MHSKYLHIYIYINKFMFCKDVIPINGSIFNKTIEYKKPLNSYLEINALNIVLIQKVLNIFKNGGVCRLLIPRNKLP